MNIRISKIKITTTTASVAFLLTAVLVIASLASIGIMQANNAAAVSKTIVRESLRQSQASADKTIEEGGITTEAGAFAYTNTAGDTAICLFYSESDTSTGTELVSLFGCGSPDEFSVSKQLDSATFSGTVTGTDVVSGEELTMTVNVDLTATGKAETQTFNQHIKTHDFMIVEHINGKVRPASGSLNISGDITFSTDDATGEIRNAHAGTLRVDRI